MSQKERPPSVPSLSTDPFDEENKDLVSNDDNDGSTNRRRSSISGSEKNAAINKRSLDESWTDEPTVPGTAPPGEAEPEVESHSPSKTPQQQPAKKRKSTSSEDETPSSSSGSLLLSPPPLLNMPTLPDLNGFFNYAPVTPLFPLIPFIMPNQFPNLCTPDFDMSTATTSNVNIEQSSNEIFESSKNGYFQPL